MLLRSSKTPPAVDGAAGAVSVTFTSPCWLSVLEVSIPQPLDAVCPPQDADPNWIAALDISVSGQLEVSLPQPLDAVCPLPQDADPDPHWISALDMSVSC